MSKKEEFKIICNNEVDRIILKYADFCITGCALGVMVGGYAGFTAALASPGIIGYGLFRVAKKIIRR
jgi:hypothetical protein